MQYSGKAKQKSLWQIATCLYEALACSQQKHSQAGRDYVTCILRLQPPIIDLGSVAVALQGRDWTGVDNRGECGENTVLIIWALLDIPQLVFDADNVSLKAA